MHKKKHMYNRTWTHVGNNKEIIILNVIFMNFKAFSHVKTITGTSLHYSGFLDSCEYKANVLERTCWRPRYHYRNKLPPQGLFVAVGSLSTTMC